jgi:hypothetical protein
MNKANLLTKLFASLGTFSIFMNVLLSGYIASLVKGKITKNDFTISQALAFGEKPPLIIFFIIGIVLIGLLIYYRNIRGIAKNKIQTIISYILLLLITVFFITIMWITVYKSETNHYIFAAIIFGSAILFVLLNSYSLWTGIKEKKLYKKIIILLIPILTILSLIALGIGLYFKMKDKVVELFPTFENVILVLTGSSIVSLGFL